MHRPLAALGYLLGACLFAAFSGTAAAQTALTTNLLLNPGAELGSLQDWTAAGPGSPTVDTGTFDPGINPHTGTYDFLGFNGASDSLSQTVSVLQQGVTAQQVDSGTLIASISFWEQGLSQGSLSDNGYITLTFLNGIQTVLSTVTSPTVDSHNGTWGNGTSSYSIPAGTRSITYTMNFVRNVGSDLDTFIDDNSMIIAQNPNYGLYLANLQSAPAGAAGLSITGYVENDTSSTADFNVCFYTGYGSTASIPLSSFTNAGNQFDPIAFSVPASTIQSIPPSVFTQGEFDALIYTVATSVSTCSGSSQAGSNAVFFPIVFPAVSSVSLASVPAPNTNLTNRVPSNLLIDGSFFLTQALYGSNSTVTLTDGDSTFTPTPVFLTDSESTGIAIPIPLDLPADGTQIGLKVCNVAPSNSYCSAVTNVPVTTLQANPATATATPSAATPTQPVTLSASFGSATNPAASVAGAPGGLVTFKDGSATLGTAPLILDTTASWVQGTSQSLTIQPYAYANSYTADFNHDGLPDVLVVDPGVASNFAGSDSSYPAFHIFLGTTPSGSFSPQRQTTVFGGSFGCDVILSSAVADFNGDGYPDVAVLCSVGGTEYIYTYLGAGDGLFTALPVSYGVAANDSQTQVYGSRIVAGDFNGDGKQDLAIVGTLDANNDTGIQFLPGDGTGNYTAGTSTTNLNTGTNSDNNYYQVVAADFNGDGYPDIAVMNGVDSDGGASNAVVFFANNKSGGFVLQTQTVPALSVNHPQLVIDRLRPQALPSVIVAYTAGSQAGFSTNPNPDGANIVFDAPITTAVPGLVQLAAGAFTGNGILDIAVVQGSNYQQSILHGDGTGNFVNSYPGLTIATAESTLPYLVTPADENGDGFADLITINSPLNDDGGFQTNSDGTITDSIQASITAGSATATRSGATFAAGTHSITASTPGTYTTAGGSATTSFVVSLPVPTVTLSASPLNSAVYGSTITLTAVVRAANATGNAAFYDGSTLLGTLPVIVGPASSTAAFTIATLAAGAHSFTIRYSGDANFAPSASTAVAYTVTQATPVVDWVPNPSTVTVGTKLSSAELDATSPIAGSFAYTPALGTVLQTAGRMVLSVTFTPTDNVDYTSVTQTVPINVVPGVGLAFNPTSITFGGQPYRTTSAAQSITITNPNTNNIDISALQVEAGADPLDFAQTNNCPATLVPSASCTMAFTFTPLGVGARTAGLIVTDDDPTKPSQGFPLFGTGTGGILQVNPGNLKTIAGTGTAGYTGDGGSALAATLNSPDGVAFDPAGNLYIADVFNAVIRKVDTSGNITTFAGTGTSGYTGDGGLATAATLDNPFSVVSDATGNIYIQDSGNNVIRKVNATTGIITTFAGTGVAGHLGDGGPATEARFNDNQGARFDQAGNLFVPQCAGASVRRIDTSGIITTVAGNFSGGFSGDGGPATAAQLQCPSGVAIAPNGVFYIADYYNNRIRKVDTQGIITTIAGDDNSAFSGDGGPATAAELSLPNDVVLDSAGNLYIADSGNNRIRKIDISGVIRTVAGGFQSAGSAGVNSPAGVTFDASGNLYFSDTSNNAIREYMPQGTAPFPATTVGTAAAPQTLTLSNIGNVAVTIASASSFTLGGNAADFSLTGGTCLNGATLAASTGSCTLQIGFTPTAAGARSLTVSIADNALNSPQSFSIGGNGTPATPVLTWAMPATVGQGTTLSSTQLDATAVDVNGAALPGTFTYTPASGTALNSPGPQTLSVLFTPNDLVDYTTATASVSINVTALSLTSISMTTAALGDPAKTITLTGTGFLATAVARANGTAILTTFVSDTSLTAVVPASAFLAIGPVKIDVVETTQNLTTSAFVINVTPPAASVTLTGPASVAPDTQPGLTFQLAAAYPVDIVATFTLGFTPASGLPDDPLILFSNGDRTYSVKVPANTTTLPVIQFQGGTVAGTISITLTLALTPEEGGTDITPSTLQPLVIPAPSAVPGATSVTLTRDGENLTVVIHGFSNTREMDNLQFHFSPAAGAQLDTPDLTLPAAPLFTPWFSSEDSFQYGSGFTYTQVFNLTADATVVGKVTVILVNSQGSSSEASAQ